MGKKEFVAAALDLEHEIFVVYVISLGSVMLPNSSPLNVHSFQRLQIAGLIAKKTAIKVLNKYLDFTDIFSPNLVSKLLKHTGINEHAIKLVDGQQPSYGRISSLKSVELKTLKAYIKTNLANGFIKLFKSPADSPIFFNRNPNGSLWLCVNDKGLKNLTIKNRDLLPLLRELLDRLRRGRRFIQLELTSAYHQIKICEENK